MALTAVTEALLQRTYEGVQDTTLGMILRMMGGDLEITSPKQGYFVGPLSMEQLLGGITIRDLSMNTSVKLGTWASNSYVDDSPEEFIEKYHELLADDNRIFAVFFTPIQREEQDPEGGWRWHKWGEYLGKHTPQREYLYDEEGIDVVYIVKILQVTS